MIGILKCSFCGFERRIEKNDINVSLKCESCQAEYGMQEKRPEDVPSKDLVDFSSLLALFKDTHGHLEPYNLIESELQLSGEAYYPIKKALCYLAESMRQDTRRVAVGSEVADNRMFIGEMLMPGRGKGQQIKLFKRYKRSEYEMVATFNPNRVHMEQLVGKIMKVKGEDKEIKGFLGYKGLFVDECRRFLNEEEEKYTDVMSEFRKAMDVWGYNEVEKKLVSDRLFSFYPETRFIFFMHDWMLSARFFDTGTYRRLFFFEGGLANIPADAAWTKLLTKKSRSDEWEKWINIPMAYDAPQIDEEGAKEIAEWVETWVLWGLLHPNIRVRAIAQKHFTSVSLSFIRLCLILGISRREQVLSKETITDACMDCIHFLLCTYQVYANRSQINLSLQIWKTDVTEEAMLFEWMWYNGATSFDETCLSISDVIDEIGEIFGLHERQAKGVFSNVVERGLIKRKKGQHQSKAWLGFKVELEGGVSIKTIEQPNITKFMEMKVSEMQKNRGGHIILKSENELNLQVSPSRTNLYLSNLSSINEKETSNIHTSNISQPNVKEKLTNNQNTGNELKTSTNLNPKSKLDCSRLILRILHDMGALNKSVPWVDVVQQASNLGFSDNFIQESKRDIDTSGDAYFPRPGYIRLTDKGCEGE